MAPLVSLLLLVPFANEIPYADTDDGLDKAENRLGGDDALACSSHTLLYTSLSLSGIFSSKSSTSPINDRTASYPEILARVAAAWLARYSPGPPTPAPPRYPSTRGPCWP